MTRIHSFALSERWSSAPNTDAFCAEPVASIHLFGMAEGLSGRPGLGSASGIAISALIDTTRKMTSSPAETLVAALRESEARIQKKKGAPPGSVRDATRLSAAIVNDSLECTILDAGEGNALVITPETVSIPADFPKASHPFDPGPVTSGPAGKPGAQMISHTLGEPHILKRADITQLGIRNLFLLMSSAGLHAHLPRDRIAGIVRRHGENVETACQELVREAQKAGSEETITIVLVHGHIHD